MKRIQAYFNNEDHAEGARIKLQSLEGVHGASVEKIPDENNELVDMLKDLLVPEEDEEHRPQVLTFEVEEDDYANAHQVVKESKGYVSDE
ncbi:hypothetical protein [Thalassobacillus sp. CUG 92003]|uniref:hypothetical protein n=1 Tax=Thalassobacillus sp. CUG 92003 TaxID=2736641 RepID=UPI0015E64342|nr:hypothetical protein [Thalassobacillus sp. CUG 92003]